MQFLNILFYLLQNTAITC